MKLFAAIGALTGVEFSLYSMMYSIFYAGLFALLVILWKKGFAGQFVCRLMRIWFAEKGQRRGECKAFAAASVRFPFMYAVLPGAATAGIVLF